MWLLFELGCPGLFGLHPPLCTVSLPLHLQRSAAVPLNESYFDRAVVVRDECGTVESAVYLVPVPVSPPCSTHTLHSRSHLSDVVHRLDPPPPYRQMLLYVGATAALVPVSESPLDVVDRSPSKLCILHPLDNMSPDTRLCVYCCLSPVDSSVLAF